MASGVSVADKVKDIIQEMKVVKKDADSNERIRVVTFRIEGDFIDIENIHREKDLEEDVFKFFLTLLGDDVCRYILYDCHYETTESKKEDLVFVSWCPDTAPIRPRMHYAASKSAIKQLVTGLKYDMQMNDLSDYGTRDGFAERLGNNIFSVEGVPLRK